MPRPPQSPAATRPSVQRSHTAPTRWLGPGRCVACFSRSWSSPRSSPFRRGIAFGPDGALYVATGDAGVPELAQDPNSRNGKFLRIPGSDLRDGGRARPQIVSLGHRNPQGIDFQPGSGRLVATEHGQEACDEVNVIRQGNNYGWPEVQRVRALFRGDFGRIRTVVQGPDALYALTSNGTDDRILRITPPSRG